MRLRFACSLLLVAFAAAQSPTRTAPVATLVSDLLALKLAIT
ncbi:MAG TPA: hypothetical protein VKY31_02990 [Terriglobia bacterium]|nr:hypothetical protein [Terriglobia bacterium]